jgi:Ser/Thr protein kinase RdoA (MazF antagonist)
MRFLADTCASAEGHRLRDAVLPVAGAILERWRTWQGRLDLPPRVTHGDLKISNLRFSPEGRGLCLLDLDTMGMLPLDVEMGDAWRSWCNPAAEDVTEARFDLDLFAASAQAWTAEFPVGVEVREALPAGIERICLELASRFCADAIHESYFGWSPRAAPGRGEHNLLRARGQLNLAKDVRDKRGALAALLS